MQQTRMTGESPDVVDFSSKGGHVFLFRQQADEPLWAGYPISPAGEACPFGLVIGSDGEARGVAALRFLAGQWASQDRRAERKDRQEVAQNLLRKFLACTFAPPALRPSGSEVAEMLQEAINLPEIAIATGSFTDKDIETAAAVGVRSAHLSAAAALGLRVAVTDLEAAFTRYVDGGNFARVCKGTWGAGSQSLAITSGLRPDVVKNLRSHGLRIEKV